MTVVPDVDDLLARGLACQRSGELSRAEDLYQRALQADASRATAWCRLGTLRLIQGRLGEAEASLLRALHLQQDAAEAHNSLGHLRYRQSRLDEALASYRRAVELDPLHAQAHNNVGIVLRSQTRLDEAMASYRRCLDIDPAHAMAHNNLGEALLTKWELDEAIASFRQAVQLDPHYAEAYSNLATALLRQARLEEAADNCRHALQLDPGFPMAHWTQCQLWLLTGDLERGFLEYEWRRHFTPPTRAYRQPLWDGRPLPTGSVLIYPEQGLGDAMQFIRYARLVKQRVGTVILECGTSLSRLLGRCAGIDRLVSPDDALPAFDVHVPLLSLPRIFRTTLESIPVDVPYLFADPVLVEHWRAQLEGDHAFKIGIAWQGNAQSPSDRQRSIPLIHFSALTRVPAVRLYSLQKGHGTEQLADVGHRVPVIELGPLDDAAGGFMDTAAVMKSLDLVITSDTSIAHLAGGLRVPVWVVLRHVPDWRWMLERSDSPWYPTMRLFRQQTLGDWGEVFRRIARELQALIAAQRGRAAFT